MTNPVSENRIKDTPLSFYNLLTCTSADHIIYIYTCICIYTYLYLGTTKQQEIILESLISVGFGQELLLQYGMVQVSPYIPTLIHTLYLPTYIHQETGWVF